jgi:hypothetical protein
MKYLAPSFGPYRSQFNVRKLYRDTFAAMASKSQQGKETVIDANRIRRVSLDIQSQRPLRQALSTRFDIERHPAETYYVGPQPIAVVQSAPAVATQPRNENAA